MKAVMTVLGKDRVGIIAGVSAVLVEQQVNILDISQTILQDYFTMIMLIDIDPQITDIAKLSEEMRPEAERLGVQVRIQHEDIFTTMHKL